MKISIDQEAQSITLHSAESTEEVPLYSKAGFELISRLYLQVGWNQKYTYTFSWMGRPVIQLPDDMLRLQEVIFSVSPDLIIETGVAHGGSLIFYASLFEALGKGHVVGVDIEIRPKNRAAIEAHPMAKRISLIEGSSTDSSIVEEVKKHVRKASTVLVILDSNHSYQHVLDELHAYAPLVTAGSYIVATDGFMRDLVDVPRGQADWLGDNPANAAEDFARENTDFELGDPPWPFNESALTQNVTHWPSAYLKKTR